MSTQNPVSVPTKRLAAAILSTDSTFQVNNILSWDAVNNLTAADFGAYGRGCFRNTGNTQIEFFTFDPATIASSSITILARGCSYKGGTTDGVATKYSWPANTTLVELGANVPALFEDYMDKTSDETITGIKTFSSSPVVPTGGTGTQAANATDIANAVTGASGTATNSTFGTVKLSVAAASVPSPIAVGDNDSRVSPVSLATVVAGQVQALAGTSGTPSSSNKYVTNADTVGTGSVLRQSYVKFGGTGADGALAISSGTTTLDLANAAYFEKNYTSISITGTGKLAFSNPNTNGTIIRLRSQGAVTLTSSTAAMIDASGMGAAGGASAAAVGANSGGNNGNNGTDISELLDGAVHKGLLGAGGATSAGSSIGGAGGAVLTSWYTLFFPIGSTTAATAHRKMIVVKAAAGGGSGGGGGVSCNSGTGGAGGAGGNGGGALLIECGGAWNFTTASGISVAGLTGGLGGNPSGLTGNGVGSGAGGGGGGGGGMFLAMYNSLTANSGTVTISGGAGGNGGNAAASGSVSGTATQGGAGGGGGALMSAGGAGAGGPGSGTGNTATAGSGTAGGAAGTGGTGAAAGSLTAGGGSGGGGGGTGQSVVIANAEWA